MAIEPTHPMIDILRGRLLVLNSPNECEFLLDYEIDEEEWGDKKKPLRYRWPDEIQAEVLARLLELNDDRSRAEARAGAPSAPGPRKTRGRKSRVAPEPPCSRLLFGPDER